MADEQHSCHFKEWREEHAVVHRDIWGAIDSVRADVKKETSDIKESIVNLRLAVQSISSKIAWATSIGVFLATLISRWIIDNIHLSMFTKG